MHIKLLILFNFFEGFHRNYSENKFENDENKSKCVQKYFSFQPAKLLKYKQSLELHINLQPQIENVSQEREKCHDDKFGHCSRCFSFISQSAFIFQNLQNIMNSYQSTI